MHHYAYVVALGSCSPARADRDETSPTKVVSRIGSDPPTSQTRWWDLCPVVACLGRLDVNETSRMSSFFR